MNTDSIKARCSVFRPEGVFPTAVLPRRIKLTHSPQTFHRTVVHIEYVVTGVHHLKIEVVRRLRPHQIDPYHSRSSVELRLFRVGWAAVFGFCSGECRTTISETFIQDHRYAPQADTLVHATLIEIGADPQFEIFVILRLIILNQRHLQNLLGNPRIEGQITGDGHIVFTCRGSTIDSFIFDNHRLGLGARQTHAEINRGILFVGRYTHHPGQIFQGLHHDSGGIRVGIIFGVHSVQTKHQFGGMGYVRSENGGARFARIQDRDFRPLYLGPARQPNGSAGHTLHHTIERHQQIGIGKLQIAGINPDVFRQTAYRLVDDRGVIFGYDIFHTIHGRRIGLILLGGNLGTVLRTA